MVYGHREKFLQQKENLSRQKKNSHNTIKILRAKEKLLTTPQKFSQQHKTFYNIVKINIEQEKFPQ